MSTPNLARPARRLAALTVACGIGLTPAADAYAPLAKWCPGATACRRPPLTRRERRAKREHKRVVAWRRTRTKVIAPFRGWLYSVRHCEWDQTQRWQSNTGNGFYGAYQFTLSSWRGVGGVGYPYLATPLEQSYRAVLLRRQQGVGAWPWCGR